MAETVENIQPMAEAEAIEQRDDGAAETAYTIGEDGNLVPVEEMVEPEAGAATPQGTPGADNREDGTVYKTQKEVDAAFGARLNAERKKVQPDIDLAKALRVAYPGKTDKEIRQEIHKLQTSSMVERGIPEAVAEELTSLRMGHEPEAAEEPPAEAYQPDNRIQQLAREASEIEAKYGINMAEILANNQELQNKVFCDGISMTEAYIMHLRAEKVGNPRPRSVTPMRNANGAGPVNTVETMSSEQFDKLWEAGRAGRKVIL